MEGSQWTVCWVLETNILFLIFLLLLPLSKVCGSSWDQWSQEPTGGASGAHTEPTAVHPGHPPASLFCLVYNLPGALFPVPVSCDMDLCPDFQSLPSAVGLDSVRPLL